MRSSITLAIALATASSASLVQLSGGHSPSRVAASLSIIESAKVLDDATIVYIFDEANTADMETGQLAVDRGRTKEVRDFGATMVRDHKAARQLGRDLAKKLGVTPTAPADDPYAKAHAAAMTKLKALKGASFDKPYLQHEVAYHKAVIEAINGTLLPATKNEELRALEVKIVPAFQAHLLMGETLEKKISGI